MSQRQQLVRVLEIDREKRGAISHLPLVFGLQARTDMETYFAQKFQGIMKGLRLSKQRLKWLKWEVQGDIWPGEMRCDGGFYLYESGYWHGHSPWPDCSDETLKHDAELLGIFVETRFERIDAICAHLNDAFLARLKERADEIKKKKPNLSKLHSGK
jgi:hypothetical protein